VRRAAVETAAIHLPPLTTLHLSECELLTVAAPQLAALTSLLSSGCSHVAGKEATAVALRWLAYISANKLTIGAAG
jgi:hypothetical protein